MYLTASPNFNTDPGRRQQVLALPDAVASKKYSKPPNLLPGPSSRTTRGHAGVAGWQGLLFLFLGLLLLSCGGREQPADEATTVIIEKNDTDTAGPITSLPAEGGDTSTLNTPVQEPDPDQQAPPPAREPSRQQTRPPQPKQDTRPAPSPPAPTPSETEPPAQPEIPPFREGAYRLSRVAGESLPLVLDMTPECDTKLIRGDLVLRNGQFRFQSYVVQECAGEAGPQEQQEAQGSYRLEGNRIFLTGATDDVMGNAEGVVEGTLIRLQRISNDEEEQEVDWLFQLQ